LNTVGPESTGTPYNRTTIGPSMKTSPLSDDAAEIESWLENQVDPKTVFKKYSFDEMKEALQEWLSPEDSAEEGDIIDDEKEEEVVASTPQKNYALKTPAPKVSNADKFDSLFEEDDDLPF